MRWTYFFFAGPFLRQCLFLIPTTTTPPSLLFYITVLDCLPLICPQVAILKVVAVVVEIQISKRGMMEHILWLINSRMTLWWAHKFDLSSMDGLHQLLCLLVPVLVVLCDTSVGGDDMWWDTDMTATLPTRRGTVAAEDAKRQETRHCDVVPDRQTVRNWWWLRRCLEVSSSSSCTKN